MKRNVHVFLMIASQMSIIILPLLPRQMPQLKKILCLRMQLLKWRMSLPIGRSIKGRKRKFGNQTRDVKKKNKNSNKPYRNYKSAQVNPKLLENYPCKCQNQCHVKLSIEERQTLFD